MTEEQREKARARVFELRSKYPNIRFKFMHYCASMCENKNILLPSLCPHYLGNIIYEEQDYAICTIDVDKKLLVKPEKNTRKIREHNSQQERKLFRNSYRTNISDAEKFSDGINMRNNTAIEINSKKATMIDGRIVYIDDIKE